MAATSKLLLAAAFAFVCIFLQSASAQAAGAAADTATPATPDIPDTCPFLGTKRTETIMECVASDQDLAQLVQMVMSDRSQAFLPEQEAKVCKQKDAVAKAMYCLMNKSLQCMPDHDYIDVTRAYHGILPSEAKLMQALTLICDNTDKFTQENIQCLENAQGEISQCAIEASLGSIPSAQGYAIGMNGIIRRAVCRSYNNSIDCLNQHQGDCNKDMMNIVEQVMKILNTCDGSEFITTTSDMLQTALIYSNVFFNNVSALMPDTCPFKDPTERRGAAMECVLANPSASITVSRLLTGQSSTSSEDFGETLCQQTGDFASVSGCLVNKAEPCFPPNIAGIPMQPIIDILPKDERFQKAFEHICKNRDRLTVENLQCMRDPENSEEIPQCLDKEVQRRMADINPDDEDSVKNAVCSGMYGVNDCLKASPGTCDDDTLKAVTDLVNIFNPCNGAAQNGLAILLLAAAALLGLFHNKIF